MIWCELYCQEKNLQMNEVELYELVEFVKDISDKAFFGLSMMIHHTEHMGVFLLSVALIESVQ